MTQKDGGLVSRAVREALGTLVSPELYEQLIGRALAGSGLDAIPEQGGAMAAWIEGALRNEIELAVGSDAADLVAEQLAPIVAHASGSAVRALAAPPRFASEQPTGLVAGAIAAAPSIPKAPPPPSAATFLDDPAKTARLRLSPEDLAELRRHDGQHTRRPQGSEQLATRSEPPRLLAASADAQAIAALQRCVPESGSVTPVTDLVGLLDALDTPGLAEPVLLVDCRKPTVHVSSIVAIGEDLPRGTTVVLWGASDEAWRELDRDRTPLCRWVRCSHEATTEDVGSLCSMLLG